MPPVVLDNAAGGLALGIDDTQPGAIRMEKACSILDACVETHTLEPPRRTIAPVGFASRRCGHLRLMFCNALLN